MLFAGPERFCIVVLLVMPEISRLAFKVTLAWDARLPSSVNASVPASIVHGPVAMDAPEPLQVLVPFLTKSTKPI